MTPSLLLASTSPYRRQLLERLGLPFVTAAPVGVDEAALHQGDPRQDAARLAAAKARSLAPAHPQGLIIGSDQIAVLDGEVLGKPVTLPNAAGQLRRASGRAVVFHTGVCLLGPTRVQVEVVSCTVHFRHLSELEIHRYLERDKPFDCAGSFKSEGLGIALFSRFEGEDPTALIGLPLIRLVAMLIKEGVAVV